MNIFINAVSVNWVLILFDSSRKIVFREDIKVMWNESSKLVWIIDKFLKKNNFSYNDLENIVVVSWPWSFTGIRTIALLVNTINYVIEKDMTSFSYFDLFDSYPICKPSSKRDAFLKKDKDAAIEIIQNTDLEVYFIENNIKEVYGELNNLFFENINTIDEINYESIISKIKLEKKKLIEPLYIKKPNIS